MNQTHPGDRAEAPELSIVIPIYNEEAILETAVTELCDKLQSFDVTYELILAENGSKDRTATIAHDLASRFPQVKVIHVGEPNYGAALKRGILESQGLFVVCDEIDLGDTNFYRQALGIMRRDGLDLVVGSKLIAGAQDRRPFLRHMASHVINLMLRVGLGFKGTDTHGLKVLRRESILPVVQSCIVDKDLFASEMVIRAERSGCKTSEIPIEVIERRKPSINLFRRVPNVLWNLVRLMAAIRLNRSL